ncbi:MAG: response regulator [Candidatus Cloacimonetes bacterium]|nr:response regulator [Candidatus Cloacimonadota bacterium]
MRKNIQIDSDNPVMMAKCLSNGEAIYLTKTLVDYLDFDDEFPYELNLFSLIHHDDQEDVLKRIAEIDKSDQSINTIHRIRLLDKRVRKNRWLISLDVDSDEEQIYNITITDIDDNTEQQRVRSDKYNPNEIAAQEKSSSNELSKIESRLHAAEEQLRWQELLLNQLAISSPVAFIVIDDRTQDIIYLSDYFCEIWNIEGLKDKIRQGMFRYKELMEICMTIVNNKSVFINNFISPVDDIKTNVVDEIELQDGKILRGYCQSIKSEELGYLGRICVFEDITERRRLINELIQNQKLESLGSLTGGIANDFEKIMSIITRHAGSLKKNKDNPQKIVSVVSKIDDCITRAENLVKQMQIFAQRSKPHFERVTVTQVIIELVSLLREIFLRKISVVLEMEPNLPKISADKVQINQALLNICLNARDAMPEGGKITISAKMVKGNSLKSKFDDIRFSQYVGIDIADNGTGIDKKTLGRIFEPFFTTKGTEKGTGLGLPVVRGIIDSHQGHIFAESSYGIGTVFHIYLPLVDEVLIEEEAIKEDKMLKRGDEIILLIEDETDLLECLKELFEMEGYRTITAVNGPSGLQLFKENRDKIALVFSDKGLPGLDGEVVMKRIRDIKPKQKYILASGFIELSKTTDEMKDENLSILQKPYKMDIIIKKVRELLDK